MCLTCEVESNGYMASGLAVSVFINGQYDAQYYLENLAPPSRFTLSHDGRLQRRSSTPTT